MSLGLKIETTNTDKEIIKHIREYVNVMKDEPEQYILLSKIYNDLKRILDG